MRSKGFAYYCVFLFYFASYIYDFNFFFLEGSGSYFELRKAYVTVDLVKSATFKSGGCYMFSNLRGCDGSRLYFSGGSSITLNGQILNRGKQFALDEVEVIVATFDLEDIRFVIFIEVQLPF